jgi:hypothetical protein
MSKITDCFLIDNSTGIACNIYEIDPNRTAWHATRYGTAKYDHSSGRDRLALADKFPRAHRNVRVPMFPFSDVEVEDRCVLLLLDAAQAGGWRHKRVYEYAEWDLRKQDLRLHSVLSSADHHLIPPGLRIAVAEPEHVGRIVASGDQRGILLFDSAGVIGYTGRGLTAYEHVMSDELFAEAG